MDEFNIISDHIVRGHHLLSGMSNKKNKSRFLSFFTRSTLWSLSHMNKVTSGQEKEHIWFQWEYRLFVWTIIFVYRMMFPFLNTICVSMYVIEFKGPKVKSMTFFVNSQKERENQFYVRLHLFGSCKNPYLIHTTSRERSCFLTLKPGWLIWCR